MTTATFGTFARAELEPAVRVEKEVYALPDRQPARGMMPADPLGTAHSQVAAATSAQTLERFPYRL